MKDSKTTILGVLAIIGTLTLAAKAVLTGGWGSVDAGLVIQTLIGALTGMGLIKAADSVT